MSDAKSVRELNEALAKQINEEARRNPNSPYANKFVGLVNGQVVVIADSADELGRRLSEIEPDPRKCFGVEASRDYTQVHEIWRLG
jgi:ubiquinone biosynthesis protein UbiJ